MKFNKYDNIKTDEGKFQCIVCDNEVAVFAPLERKPNGNSSVKYKDIFVVLNSLSDTSFKFERI